MHTNLKKISLCLVVVLAVALSYFFSIQLRHLNFQKKSFSVNSIDRPGMFVGENPSVLTQSPNRVDQEIDYVWSQVHIAGIREKEGKLAEAAEFYKKAVYGLSNSQQHIIPGRSMAATDLIRIYEKLGQYGDALEVIDWLEKIYISESGKKYCVETRTRLLRQKAGGQVAAKEQA